jgi:energy-coupling factor transporter ATP-binding protein EcfA2
MKEYALMDKIDIDILTIDKVICKNIDELADSNVGFLSQNILSQLRNFIEHISLKIYGNGQDIEDSYENIKRANYHVKTVHKLNFLSKFHYLLQEVASHYTLDEENSERLMLKYYEYLLKIKSFLKDSYNIDVLNNINKFPINTDSNLREYYEKIATVINRPQIFVEKNAYKDNYYIQKIKPFFVEYNIYYEVTFTKADDKVSKFDRIIAFTKQNLLHNYAVKLGIRNDNIQILGKDMPVLIIHDWKVSIRQCEFNNFADIFGSHSKIQNSSIEYKELMKFLTRTCLNLVEFLDFEDEYYLQYKNQIIQKANSNHIFEILDKCRDLIKNNRPGCCIIKYLLYKLKNKIIKKQYSHSPCGKLSQLNLEYKCIPFDEMPYCSSLISHNPKLSDIFDCIEPKGREHEIFARFIKNNTENKGQLYTSEKDITNFAKIEELMNLYNSNLYYKHKSRSLENYKEHIYIKEYEEDAVSIIRKLKELSSDGIENYENSVNYWLKSSAYAIDCEEKKTALKQMFEKSCVVLIYGSAGTGKSTLIRHISHFFNDNRKLYLANTNPAVDNLIRKVDVANCTFKTIAKFLSPKDIDSEYDLLIIDECSTVSNSDMRKILQKASFKLLILVGDVFQIESIVFGNWFNIARFFIQKTSIFELTKPYRSNNPDLLLLWDKVRNTEEGILEHIVKNNYSVTLNESIFEHTEEDEIVLCLNYDGLYGINNINRFLQINNDNISVEWDLQTYKINDPILFNESERFAPLIYNNLKGKIVGIEKFDDKIQFDIELSKVINSFDTNGYEIEFIGNSGNGNSIIRFFVHKYESIDEDENSALNTLVPFQIAYAISIHKAQGLEYNSVKIVVTDEIEEMITHNIFYTAITRAKEKLKIYWSPNVENKILKNLKSKMNKKDGALLGEKFGLKS